MGLLFQFLGIDKTIMVCYNNIREVETYMLKAFLTLFTEADVVFYILLALAVMLLVAEVFIPSFGIVGMSGLLAGIGAIIDRCVVIENTKIENVLYIVYIVVLLASVVGIFKLFQKMDKIRKDKKSYAIVDGNKIPLTSDGFLDYSFLVGKEGVVVSDLKPAGKAEIEGKVYEVTATKEYIYSGTHIRVDKIINQRVVVKKKK